MLQKHLQDHRRKIVGAAAVAAGGLCVAGAWAAVGAPTHAAPASDGRVLQVSYEVRREPPYAPPPVTEATRLDVMDAQSPTVVEDGVLSAQAGDALRTLATEDTARTAAALAEVRAQDTRIDRETAAALRDERAEAGPATEPAPAASVS